MISERALAILAIRAESVKLHEVTSMKDLPEIAPDQRAVISLPAGSNRPAAFDQVKLKALFAACHGAHLINGEATEQVLKSAISTAFLRQAPVAIIECDAASELHWLDYIQSHSSLLGFIRARVAPWERAMQHAKEAP